MEATKTNRRQFLKAIAAGAAALALPRSLSLARRAGDRPNILFIMADDHAANAISCYGSRLNSVAKTPNIDRIAAAQTQSASPAEPQFLQASTATSTASIPSQTSSTPKSKTSPSSSNPRATRPLFSANGT